MIKKTASKKILTPSDSVSNDAPQNNKDFDDIKTQDILSKINLTDIFTKYSVLIPIILSL